MTITQTIGALFDERLARRKKLRERLAKNELIDRRCEEIRAAIADTNGKLDRETEKHAAATRPIQEGLATVEREELDAMVSQVPVDDSLATRRAELLERLEAANVALEEAADSHKRRLAVLNRELTEQRNNRDNEVVPMFLANPTYANPDLLDHNYVSQKRIQWAVARLKAAQDRVTLCTDTLAEHRNRRPCNVATYNNIRFDGTIKQPPIDSAETNRIEMHLRRARLEAAAALEEHNAAIAEAAKIYEAMLAE